MGILSNINFFFLLAEQGNMKSNLVLAFKLKMLFYDILLGLRTNKIHKRDYM